MSTKYTREQIEALVDSTAPEDRKTVMSLLKETGLNVSESIQLKGPDRKAHLIDKLGLGGKAAGKAAAAPGKAAAAGKAANPAAAKKAAKEPEPEAEPEAEAEAEDNSAAMAELYEKIDALTAQLVAVGETMGVIQTVALENLAVTRAIAANLGLSDDDLKELKDLYHAQLLYTEGNE